MKNRNCYYKLIPVLFFFGPVSLLAASWCLAAEYTVTDLGTLGGTESFAYAINDDGDVIGTSQMPGDITTHPFLFSKGVMSDIDAIFGNGTRYYGSIYWDVNNFNEIVGVHLTTGHAFLYSGGVMNDLGTLGGDYSHALGINNLGEVVGYSYTSGADRHAFLYSGGVMTDLGSFGGYSCANAVNDSGVAIGFSAYTSHGTAHAFLYRNGIMEDIDPFGGGESYARGINSLGQVVGEGLIRDDDAFHGFLYSDGLITDLGVLEGGRNSVPFAINDYGEIVGFSDTSHRQSAFLYDNGVMTDLNILIPPDSGWILSKAVDTNDAGQIVGIGMINGIEHAFLLTPVPQRPMTQGVKIDIQPRSDTNRVNYKVAVRIGVGILSTPDFDASSQVDRGSLTFGRTGEEQSLASCNPRPIKVNNDVLKDLVCYFYTRDTGFGCGDTVGILRGKTVDGVSIKGVDSIEIVPCP